MSGVSRSSWALSTFTRLRNRFMLWRLLLAQRVVDFGLTVLAHGYRDEVAMRLYRELILHWRANEQRIRVLRGG